MKSQQSLSSNKQRKHLATLQSAAACFLMWLFYKSVSATFRLSSINLYHFTQDRYDAYDQVKAYKDPLDTEIGHPTLDPDISHLHIGEHAMVASDVPLCSTMGKNILLQGGNAADAAVTVALCIGSINSHSSGLGGGGFILSRALSKSDPIISIDGREMAPEHASKEMYADNRMGLIVGGLAAGVPGEIKALDELFSRHGSGNLTWLQVIEPVIALNRDGFECLQVLANAFEIEDTLFLSKVPELRKTFGFLLLKNGSRVRKGDWIKRPQLADTLEIIAKNGLSRVFYDPCGPIAPSLVQAASKHGGILTGYDFRNYEAIVELPLETNLVTPQSKNLTLYTTRGVSLGLALIAGVQFFTETYRHDDTATMAFHKLIESFKWLASVRLRLGDYGIPSRIEKLVSYFSDSQWVYDRIHEGKYLDKQTFHWTNYEPEYQLTEGRGTSHFAIVDANNNAVSMTTTVNLLFGSLVHDVNTGIILNNQMDDFSQPHTCNSFGLAPSIYNYVKGQKRPLLSAAPVIIIDRCTGIPDMVIGAAGGLRITTSILNVIVRTYLFGQELVHAVSAPRIHDQLIPMEAMVEDPDMIDEEFGASIMAELTSMGHNITTLGPRTALNAVTRKNGTTLQGVSDYWRKLGEADGY